VGREVNEGDFGGWIPYQVGKDRGWIPAFAGTTKGIFFYRKLETISL